MDSARSEIPKANPPANDALLAQLVRGAERDEVEKVARTVPGVEGVMNKLRVT